MDQTKVNINNEYDYSNVIPDTKVLLWIFEYLDNCYKWLINIEQQEEERNKILKYEMQNYDYKKSYAQKLEVNIREKGSSNIICNDIETFKQACNEGHLKNVESVKIELNMSYKRGGNSDYEEHENVFKIVFRPYEILFTRSSNYNEEMFNQIEQNINDMFKKCPIQNTIFCTK